MKKWPKGVVFWTIKGGVKSSNPAEVKARASPDFRKKRKEKMMNKVHREPKACAVNKSGAGRPNSLDDEKLVQLFDAYYSRPYSFRELADMFGVSRMTVWRAVQDAPSFQR